MPFPLAASTRSARSAKFGCQFQAGNGDHLLDNQITELPLGAAQILLAELSLDILTCPWIF